MSGHFVNVACHKRPITDLKFNYDGDLIFTASKDSTSIVLKSDGSPLGVYKGHEGSIMTLSVSKNSRTLLTGSADLSGIVWDVEKGILKQKLKIGSVIKASDNFDNEHMFVLCSDDSMGKPKGIVVVDTRVKTINKMIHLKTNPTGVMVNYTQNYIIVSDEDGSLQKVDIRAGTFVSSKKIHSGNITSIKPSACRTFMITSSSDAQAKIIDIDDLDTVKTFVCEEPINCADIFSSNDKVVCVGGVNARDVTTTKGKHGFDTSFFDIITTERIGYYQTHYGAINCVDISKGDDMYCSAGEEGLVLIVKFGEDFFNAGFTPIKELK